MPRRKKQPAELQLNPSSDSITHPSPAPVPKYPSTTKGLKRKIQDLETQATSLNDCMINLEVMIQENDNVIDYQHNCIDSLKKKNCDNKKAGNLVSMLQFFFVLICLINVHNMLKRYLTCIVF